MPEASGWKYSNCRGIRRVPVSLACRSGKELFTGDAIGSGDIVLMTLPGALSVSAYCASLERFVQRAGAYADTEWRGGHCGQAGIPGTPAYNPPRMQGHGT